MFDSFNRFSGWGRKVFEQGKKTGGSVLRSFHREFSRAEETVSQVAHSVADVMAGKSGEFSSFCDKNWDKAVEATPKRLAQVQEKGLEVGRFLVAKGEKITEGTCKFGKGMVARGRELAISLEGEVYGMSQKIRERKVQGANERGAEREALVVRLAEFKTQGLNLLRKTREAANEALVGTGVVLSKNVAPVFSNVFNITGVVTAGSVLLNACAFPTGGKKAMESGVPQGVPGGGRGENKLVVQKSPHVAGNGRPAEDARDAGDLTTPTITAEDVSAQLTPTINVTATETSTERGVEESQSYTSNEAKALALLKAGKAFKVTKSGMRKYELAQLMKTSESSIYRVTDWNTTEPLSVPLAIDQERWLYLGAYYVDIADKVPGAPEVKSDLAELLPYAHKADRRGEGKKAFALRVFETPDLREIRRITTKGGKLLETPVSLSSDPYLYLGASYIKVSEGEAASWDVNKVERVAHDEVYFRSIARELQRSENFRSVAFPLFSAYEPDLARRFMARKDIDPEEKISKIVNWVMHSERGFDGSLAEEGLRKERIKVDFPPEVREGFSRINQALRKVGRSEVDPEGFFRDITRIESTGGISFFGLEKLKQLKGKSEAYQLSVIRSLIKKRLLGPPKYGAAGFAMFVPGTKKGVGKHLGENPAVESDRETLIADLESAFLSFVEHQSRDQLLSDLAKIDARFDLSRSVVYTAALFYLNWEQIARAVPEATPDMLLIAAEEAHYRRTSAVEAMLRWNIEREPGTPFNKYLRKRNAGEYRDKYEPTRDMRNFAERIGLRLAQGETIAEYQLDTQEAVEVIIALGGYVDPVKYADVLEALKTKKVASSGSFPAPETPVRPTQMASADSVTRFRRLAGNSEIQVEDQKKVSKVDLAGMTLRDRVLEMTENARAGDTRAAQRMVEIDALMQGLSREKREALRLAMMTAPLGIEERSYRS